MVRYFCRLELVFKSVQVSFNGIEAVVVRIRIILRERRRFLKMAGQRTAQSCLGWDLLRRSSTLSELKLSYHRSGTYHLNYHIQPYFGNLT